MDKHFLRKSNGYTVVDALGAILIIVLFVSLIATISYNIYIANSSLKRMSQAKSYIMDIFGYIDKNYYDDINNENLMKYFNNKYYYEQDKVTIKKDAKVKILNDEIENVDVPYKIIIRITKFNETTGNEEKLDLVKEIEVEIKYKVGNKDQKINMKTIKNRENFEIPNRPNISKISLQQDEKVYCLKKEKNIYKVCNDDDKGWYNYETGNWARVLKTKKDLKVDEIVNINQLTNEENVYIWIPRYAYISNNVNTIEYIKFLYKNTNKYIQTYEIKDEEYTKLIEIDETYKVDSDFNEDSKLLEGIWITNKNCSIYKTLNEIYPYNK